MENNIIQVLNFKIPSKYLFLFKYSGTFIFRYTLP